MVRAAAECVLASLTDKLARCPARVAASADAEAKVLSSVESAAPRLHGSVSSSTALIPADPRRSAASLRTAVPGVGAAADSDDEDNDHYDDDDEDADDAGGGGGGGDCDDDSHQGAAADVGMEAGAIAAPADSAVPAPLDRRERDVDPPPSSESVSMQGSVASGAALHALLLRPLLRCLTSVGGAPSAARLAAAESLLVCIQGTQDFGGIAPLLLPALLERAGAGLWNYDTQGHKLSQDANGEKHCAVLRALLQIHRFTHIISAPVPTPVPTRSTRSPSPGPGDQGRPRRTIRRPPWPQHPGTGRGGKAGRGEVPLGPPDEVRGDQKHGIAAQARAGTRDWIGCSRQGSCPCHLRGRLFPGGCPQPVSSA